MGSMIDTPIKLAVYLGVTLPPLFILGAWAILHLHPKDARVQGNETKWRGLWKFITLKGHWGFAIGERNNGDAKLVYRELLASKGFRCKTCTWLKFYDGRGRRRGEAFASSRSRYNCYYQYDHHLGLLPSECDADSRPDGKSYYCKGDALPCWRFFPRGFKKPGLRRFLQRKTPSSLSWLSEKENQFRVSII